MLMYQHFTDYSNHKYNQIEQKERSKQQQDMLIPFQAKVTVKCIEDMQSLTTQILLFYTRV